MDDLILNIAQIEVPHDLLDQIDVNDVLSKFRENFKRLDGLKQARNAHEQRNAIMRWWHNDKLKDAQLDAQELQAEFSKSLAQLMAISMLQSQRLAHQQGQIGSQQQEIKRQTERLSLHAEQLEAQQGRLHQQAVDLKSLVDNYFELRGLTQEGAQKLIAIAADVKDTRDELIGSVQSFVGVLREEHGQLKQFVRDAVASLEELAAARSEQISRDVEKRCAALASRLESTNMRHVQAQQAMAADINTHEARVSAQADVLARLEMDFDWSKGQVCEMQMNLGKAEIEAKQNVEEFNMATRRIRYLTRLTALLSVLALVSGVVSLAIAAHWIRF